MIYKSSYMPLNVRNDTKTSFKFYLSDNFEGNRRTSYCALHSNLLTQRRNELRLKVTFFLPQGISLSKQTPFSLVAATALSEIYTTKQ